MTFRDAPSNRYIVNPDWLFRRSTTSSLHCTTWSVSHGILLSVRNAPGHRESLDWREIHRNSLAVTCSRKCCNEQLAPFLSDLPFEISTPFVTHSFIHSFYMLEYSTSFGTGGVLDFLSFGQWSRFWSERIVDRECGLNWLGRWFWSLFFLFW